MSSIFSWLFTFFSKVTFLFLNKSGLTICLKNCIEKIETVFGRFEFFSIIFKANNDGNLVSILGL